MQEYKNSKWSVINLHGLNKEEINITWLTKNIPPGRGPLCVT